MSSAAVVIPEGNAIDIAIRWHDMTGEDEDPTAVRYRVFDATTGDPVADEVDVDTPAAEMTITVPGTELPGGSRPMRRLAIQIEATFGAGDKHTEVVNVVVRRGYEWS